MIDKASPSQRSNSPGVYFQALLIGYFEGLESDHGNLGNGAIGYDYVEGNPIFRRDPTGELHIDFFYFHNGCDGACGAGCTLCECYLGTCACPADLLCYLHDEYCNLGGSWSCPPEYDWGIFSNSGDDDGQVEGFTGSQTIKSPVYGSLVPNSLGAMFTTRYRREGRNQSFSEINHSQSFIGSSDEKQCREGGGSGSDGLEKEDEYTCRCPIGMFMVEVVCKLSEVSKGCSACCPHPREPEYRITLEMLRDP